MVKFSVNSNPNPNLTLNPISARLLAVANQIES